MEISLNEIEKDNLQSSVDKESFAQLELSEDS